MGDYAGCKYSYAGTQTLREIIGSDSTNVQIRFMTSASFAYYEIGIALDSNVIDPESPCEKKGLYAIWSIDGSRIIGGVD